MTTTIDHRLTILKTDGLSPGRLTRPTGVFAMRSTTVRDISIPTAVQTSEEPIITEAGAKSMPPVMLAWESMTDIASDFSGVPWAQGCPGCPGCVPPRGGTAIRAFQTFSNPSEGGVPAVPAENIPIAHAGGRTHTHAHSIDVPNSRDSRDTPEEHRLEPLKPSNRRPTPQVGQPGHPGHRGSQ